MDHFLAICGAVASIYAGDLFRPEALAALPPPESAAILAAVGAVAGYLIFEIIRRITS